MESFALFEWPPSRFNRTDPGSLGSKSMTNQRLADRGGRYRRVGSIRRFPARRKVIDQVYSEVATPPGLNVATSISTHPSPPLTSSLSVWLPGPRIVVPAGSVTNSFQPSMLSPLSRF
jgi:hypothetical protein